MNSTLPTAAVTGAGSGIGRAVVLKLAAHGWRVALVGRRAASLDETVALAPPDAAAQLACFACDISDAIAVQKMAALVSARFGDIHALVNSAGVNTKRRGLD